MITPTRSVRVGTSPEKRECRTRPPPSLTWTWKGQGKRIPNGLPNRPLKGVGQNGKCQEQGLTSNIIANNLPTHQWRNQREHQTTRGGATTREPHGFHPCALATKPLRYTWYIRSTSNLSKLRPLFILYYLLCIVYYLFCHVYYK
jgi:hypothetical protein